MFWKAPSCPIDDERRAWFDDRWAWLKEELGVERARQARVLTPTPADFPDPWDGSEEAAEALFERVRAALGLAGQPLRTGWYEPEEGSGPPGAGEGLVERHGAAGVYFEADLPVVMLSTELLTDTTALVATVAHELGHVILLGQRRLERDDPDHEPLTDLLTVFLGLGVFTANATIRERNWELGAGHAWSVGRQGYLTHEEWGYALALLARERGQDARAPWAGWLRPDVAEPFRESLRFLAGEPDARSASPPPADDAPAAPAVLDPEDPVLVARRRGRAWRQLLVGSAALVGFLALLLTGALGSRDLPLYAVNGTPQPARVRLRTAQGKLVLDRELRPGVELLYVPIGECRLEVDHLWGKDQLSTRFTRSPSRLAERREVPVLNVAGAAPVLREALEYAPLGGPAPAGLRHELELHSGWTLRVFADITDPFQEFPPEATTIGGSWIRTRLTAWTGDPLRELEHLPDGVPPAQVLAWLEHRLELDPDDRALATGYLQLAASHGQSARAQARLAGRANSDAAPLGR